TCKPSRGASRSGATQPGRHTRSRRTERWEEAVNFREQIQSVLNKLSIWKAAVVRRLPSILPNDFSRIPRFRFAPAFRYAEVTRNMSRRSRKYRSSLMALLLAGATAFFASAASAQSTAPETFATPDDAMQALVKAANAKDADGLKKIFGADWPKLLSG